VHFTYQPPRGDLQQGDVLVRTPEVDEVLREVHPHYYGRTEYRNLIVLTQSCELVRRELGGAVRCKTRYVTVAAVRPLQTALDRELQKRQRSDRERRAGYCVADARVPVRQFVARLLNNNEPGYFYLHGESSALIDEPRVAFLALSIALKADLHYDKLLAARVAQLTPEFQAKLGELVGNLYARVGTTDWYEHIPSTDFDSMVDSIVDGLCSWVDGEFMGRIKREEKQRAKTAPGYQMSAEDVTEFVDTLAAERAAKKNALARRAAEVLRELKPDLPEGDVERFEAYLLNDVSFSGATK
jgi:hypothetical protein